MQRLKLDLDHLQVQSFATTGPAADASGTVHGHMVAVTDDPETCVGSIGCYSLGCPSYTCLTGCNDTCYASCGGTCDATCGGSCDGTCGSGDTGGSGNDTSYGYTFLVSCCPRGW